ncbi:matrixin family metalloprotease [Fodinicola feengrottensis]|uniref:matrixin family metalloprotease n=1 Tax=Fodinicola feengrottensis TaxID=435914 RepID=UPI0031E12ADB
MSLVAVLAVTGCDPLPVRQASHETNVFTPPPLPADARSRPLGRPGPLPADTGPYKITLTQGTSQAPVAYDPCRPIHYVTNRASKPRNGDAVLREALARLGAATGLHFHDDGATTEVPVPHRPDFQPKRYGNRWAPVLISWSDPQDLADLDGPVVGIGYSDSYGDPGQRRYVSGTVVLDGPQINEWLKQSGGRARARAIIEHELGHLVGLGHVHDPHEIMNPDASVSTTDYGPGDLHGLALLGTGRCFRDA